MTNQESFYNNKNEMMLTSFICQHGKGVCGAIFGDIVHRILF